MEGLRAALGLEAAPGGSEENTCSYEIFAASSGAQAAGGVLHGAAARALCALAVPAEVSLSILCMQVISSAYQTLAEWFRPLP